MERWTSLIFVNAEHTVDIIKPSFRIFIRYDMSQSRTYLNFENLAKPGFVFRRVPAGHHLVQAAIFSGLKSLGTRVESVAWTN